MDKLKMDFQISVVNFNTTDMTNAALKSIRRFSQAPIVVFDNSNIRRFYLDDEIINANVIDNTQCKIIDFNADFLDLDNKYKIPASIKKIEKAGSNFGSYKHCKTIQWLIDNCQCDNMVLFDSDIVVLKNFTDIIDMNVITSAEIHIGHRHYSRFYPFIQYFNCKMIKSLGLKYFDDSRMLDISWFYEGYDTGGSFYEDVIKLQLPFKSIHYENYIKHYGASSWKPTKLSGKLEYLN